MKLTMTVAYKSRCNFVVTDYGATEDSIAMFKAMKSGLENAGYEPRLVLVREDSEEL